jgi:hypothetical protein
MSDDIVQELKERATRRLGDVRTAEIAEDIAKVAAELKAIRQYPISIDDEP